MFVYLYLNFRLLRLLDERYKGIAHGVGQTEILGRIHVAPIKVLKEDLPISCVCVCVNYELLIIPRAYKMCIWRFLCSTFIEVELP